MKKLLTNCSVLLALIFTGLSHASLEPPAKAAANLLETEGVIFEHARLAYVQTGQTKLQEGEYIIFTSAGEIVPLEVEEWGTLDVQSEWAIIIKVK